MVRGCLPLLYLLFPFVTQCVTNLVGAYRIRPEYIYAD